MPENPNNPDPWRRDGFAVSHEEWESVVGRPNVGYCYPVGMAGNRCFVVTRHPTVHDELQRHQKVICSRLRVHEIVLVPEFTVVDDDPYNVFMFPCSWRELRREVPEALWPFLRKPLPISFGSASKRVINRLWRVGKPVFRTKSGMLRWLLGSEAALGHECPIDHLDTEARAAVVEGVVSELVRREHGQLTSEALGKLASRHAAGEDLTEQIVEGFDGRNRPTGRG